MAKLPDRAEIVIDLREDRIYAFDSTKRYVMALSDFIESSISGHLKSTTGPLRNNFESCLIHDATFEDIHLLGCDFLDTHITCAKFIKCDLDQTHFAGCIIKDTDFDQSRFYFTNDTETTFINCTFMSCNFERFIFKYCRFYNCTFSACSSTNRLFDTCTFTDCAFTDLTLQVATVASNIGLNRDDFRRCLFRTDRSYEGHTVLDLDQLVSLLERENEDPFKAAMVTYFTEGPGFNFHNRIDVLFSDLSWFGNFVSKSINEKLNGLVTLLFHLYSEDKLLAIVLLRLQDFLNSLSVAIQDTQSQPSRSVAQTVDGLRLQTARQIQPLLDRLELASAGRGPADRVVLEGDGPLSRKFYAELFDFVPDIYVSDVKPRNSPLLVQIDLMTVGAYAWIVAVLLSTRLRYQIGAADQPTVAGPKTKSLRAAQASESGRALVSAPRPASFDLQLGSLDDRNGGFGIQAVALFSSGICHRFHLSFSMTRAFSLHRHVSSIFSGSGSAPRGRSKS